MDYIKVPDIRIDLDQNIRKRIDELIFQALKPFGITKENCKDYKKQMFVWCDGVCQHYFVDGYYAFSFCYCISDINITCSIDILEGMKGVRCNGDTTSV